MSNPVFFRLNTDVNCKICNKQIKLYSICVLYDTKFVHYKCLSKSVRQLVQRREIYGVRAPKNKGKKK